MCECGDGREYPFGCTSVYQDCHSCGAKCKVIEIDTEEGEEELLSNCCGAKIDGLNASGIGRCSECKEGCGVEEVEMEKMDIFIEILGNDENEEVKLSEPNQ